MIDIEDRLSSFFQVLNEARKCMMMLILVLFAHVGLRLATFSIAPRQTRVPYEASGSRENLECTSAEPADLPEASSRQ